MRGAGSFIGKLSGARLAYQTQALQPHLLGQMQCLRGGNALLRIAVLYNRLEHMRRNNAASASILAVGHWVIAFHTASLVER
jgi:hypothetical protein